MAQQVTPESQRLSAYASATLPPYPGPAVNQAIGNGTGAATEQAFRQVPVPFRSGGVFGSDFPSWLTNPLRVGQAHTPLTPEPAAFHHQGDTQYSPMWPHEIIRPANPQPTIYDASNGMPGHVASSFTGAFQPDVSTRGANGPDFDILRNAWDNARASATLYPSPVASGRLPITYSTDRLSSVGVSTPPPQGSDSQSSLIRYPSQAAHSPEIYTPVEAPMWNAFQDPSKMPQWIGKTPDNPAALTLAPATKRPSQAASPVSRSGFRPMAAVSCNKRATRNGTSQAVAIADHAAFSSNYRGEHSARNASVRNLKPGENCALWLTNLPPDCTYHELLGTIRNCGRIWCAVINKPDYVRHVTAAAKIVFFNPRPAQTFLGTSLFRGVTIRNHRIKVTENRVKYKEEPMTGSESRVLIITGSSKFVNEKALTEFFRQRFVFEVDEVLTLIHAEQRTVLEYKFGSFRCQAHMGKMALEKDRPEGLEKVEYGEDPCEVGETMSSYGVAGYRIQGR
ncbi:hypothetical protein BGZ61DRAFT_481963 [Ilyonectria robusta]|uniref:uncharacterized protein n=1 Tax=Ilyonectria robusta TaxID=1079257 RepID=UPI001E8CC6DE|nr:uncharacterized protein BGZ61DRAFT_481963 [Ilyonectria robusta]KAH8674988.1 hypothetical protein BGZ61DRAFT_481963 [Ilyonectria robusta]